MNTSQKIGQTKSVATKSGTSLKTRTSSNRYKQKHDLLEIPDYIQKKYGERAGYKLAWLPINSFGSGFNEEGYSLVAKDDEDKKQYPSLVGFSDLNKHDANPVLQNYFTYKELVLARIPLEDYNEKQEYTRQESLRNRGKKDYEKSEMIKAGLKKLDDKMELTFSEESVNIPAKNLAGELNKSVE